MPRVTNLSANAKEQPIRATPNRRYGKHTSIAGGLARSLERAAELGCSSLQIFSRNPRGWVSPPLDDAEAAEFREVRARLGLSPVVVHDNYLINLASLDPSIRERSIEAFRDELERGVRVGADFLVTHPGSAKGGCRTQGIEACVAAIKEAARGVRLEGLTILIENTAGQGGCIGRSFEEVGEIVAACEDDLPMGVCLDTAHTFAAGYDLLTQGAFESTVRALDEAIGFDRVRVIHFNDSKVGLGANVDRHWHLGEGAIGFEALARLARFAPLEHAAIILETPEDDLHDATWNLDQLRRMLAQGECGQAARAAEAQFDSPQAAC
jgi:deoxyribonuclease-4